MCTQTGYTTKISKETSIPPAKKEQRVSNGVSKNNEFVRHWRYSTITGSKLFKFRSRFRNNTINEGIVNIKIAVPLTYLSNFWRILKMSVINSKINLMLKWPANSVICEAHRAANIAITDTKFYVPLVILSTQDNPKLLQQLKSGFKRATNWNKCQ